MSAKYFCDICGKEVQPTRLLPRKNGFKVKGEFVEIFVSLKVGVNGWHKGEICTPCTLEAVDSYLRGIGSVTKGPDYDE